MTVIKFLLLSFCIPAVLLAQSKETQTVNNRADSILKANNIEVRLGMTGRKIISFPIIHDTLTKILRVVVAIQADRQGNITWAKASLKGSTTSDTHIFQLAQDAALKTKISADPSAAEEQFGTIL